MKMHKSSSHRDKIVREAELFRKGAKTILAIDEAGRGPLAGPLVVAGLLVTPKTFASLSGLGVDDSKRLRPTVREKIFKKIKTLRFRHHIVQHSAQWIDRRGIQAAWRDSIRALIEHFNPDITLIDGQSLKNISAIDPRRHQRKSALIEFWIKGDQRLNSIGAASIIAKVSRDRLMCQLAKKYPRYHFDQHKGYGTARHCALIQRYGLCPAHRKSFCKSFL